MKTIGLIAIMAYSLVYSSAQVNQPHPVERGDTVSVTMHFNSAIQSGMALLIWQTYDDTAISQSRDKGMALMFKCSGNFSQTADIVTIPCTVPSDVADGHYYLVSASLGDTENQRTYSWRGDLPSDLVMSVKGGPTSVLPNLKSVEIHGTER
jgi:hypothetical protein